MLFSTLFLFFGCKELKQVKGAIYPEVHSQESQRDTLAEDLNTFTERLYSNLSIKNYFMSKDLPDITNEDCTIRPTLFMKLNLMPSDGSIEYYIHYKYFSSSWHECPKKEVVLKRISMITTKNDLKLSIQDIIENNRLNNDGSRITELQLYIENTNDEKGNLTLSNNGIFKFNMYFDLNTITLRNNNGSFLKLDTNESDYYEHLSEITDERDETVLYTSNPFKNILNIIEVER